MPTSIAAPSPEDVILVEAYDQMRMLARRRLIQMGGQSLQATELVNEAVLRLIGRRRVWRHRSELFGLVGRSMRDILVERTRRRLSKRRGGDWRRVEWKSALQVATEYPDEFLMLDEALLRLSKSEPEYARVIELMFFVGLTGDETADALNVSASTVDRRWRLARAWLHRELSEG